MCRADFTPAFSRKGAAKLVADHKVQPQPHAALAPVAFPAPQPTEFFINVKLHGFDSAENAASAVKAQGRQLFGRSGSMFGSIFSSGSALAPSMVRVPDAWVVKEASDAVVQCTCAVLLQQGWQVLVTQFLLPPLPGQRDWQQSIPFERDGHFMVFRVQLLKHVSSEASSHIGDIMNFCKGLLEMCCPPKPIEPPAFSLRNSECGRTLQDALRNRRNPIHAEIQIGTAQDECRMLNHFGWSDELSYRAVAESRNFRVF